jgi:hypothetical protein
MSQHSQHIFLSSGRRGLACHIGETAATAKRAIVNVTLKAAPKLKDIIKAAETQEVSRLIELFGPSDVVGIDPVIISRVTPEPDSGNVEPNYFAAIEFHDWDFPWQLSPEPYDPVASRINRPWLTLIVLTRDEFEAHPARGENLPSYISVNSSSLPNLDHTWRWAHIHLTSGAERSTPEVQELLQHHPEQAVSRLLCPRKLKPNTPFTAFLVPAYKLGVEAGLGQALSAELSTLAWTHDAGNLEIPYYYRWEFSTGQRGDFEHLVNLLEPRQLTGLGLKPIDCSAPGFGVQGVHHADPSVTDPHHLGMEGALQSTDLGYTAWGKDAPNAPENVPEDLQADLAELINRADTDQLTLRYFSPEMLAESLVVLKADGDTAVTISWHTAQPCKAQISYRPEYDSPAKYWRTERENRETQDHQLELTELKLGFIYRFTITLSTSTETVETEERTFAMPPSLPAMVPPLYGQWHTGQDQVDASNPDSWQATLNLDPRHRAAAGLGAKVIQKHQEALMASAWEQLGEYEEAKQVLRFAQFGRAATHALHHRLEAFSSNDFLRFTGPVLSRVLTNANEPEQRITLKSYLQSQTVAVAAALDPALERRLRGPMRKHFLGPCQDLVARLTTNPQEMVSLRPLIQGALSLNTISTVIRPAQPAEINDLPTEVDFGIVASDTQVRESVQLQNKGEAVLQITGIRLHPPSADLTIEHPTLPISLAGGESCPVTISYQPAQVGEVNRLLQIRSDASGVKNIRLKGRRSSTPQPKLKLSQPTESLNFGDVSYGTPSPRIIQVRNIGCAPLTITQIALDSSVQAEFRIVDPKLPTTIPPRGNLAVKVVYTPNQGTGESTGQLMIETNDPDARPMQLSLNGIRRLRLEVSPVPVSGSENFGLTSDAINSEKIRKALEEEPQAFPDSPILPNLDDLEETLRSALDDWLNKTPKGQTVTPYSSQAINDPNFIQTTKAHVVSALDPEHTIVERVKNRLAFSGPLERRFSTNTSKDSLDNIRWAPELTQPTSQLLSEMSHGMLLPGIETIPQNTIGILKSNSRFIESFMCGCNHEFAAELLWRGYPTDQRGTYFRTFWNYDEYKPTAQELKLLLNQWLQKQDSSHEDVSSVAEIPQEVKEALMLRHPDDAGDTSDLNQHDLITLITRLILKESLKDIAPLPAWRNQLGENIIERADLLLIIRGDLLKRYPDALIYAVGTIGAGDNRLPNLPEVVGVRPSELDFPILQVTLPPDITLLGFSFSEDDARGTGDQGGKFFIFEESPSAPRFGLDQESGHGPSWKDFKIAGKDLADGQYLDEATQSPQGWGDDTTSSAWRAKMTLQKTFRLAVHASKLIPS